LDEVWLVVTPTSPHKQGVDLIPEEHRLQMVKLALADHPQLRASSVEFDLPRPNYTARTMEHLRASHPDTAFSIIMGQDNLASFSTWQDHTALLDQHRLLIYPRLSDRAVNDPSEVDRWMVHPHVEVQKAPVIAISSTYIRDAIMAGHDVQFLLPDAVVAYIGNNHFYEQA
jgi:nicotinate-nucleotide adenylyltransferase